MNLARFALLSLLLVSCTLTVRAQIGINLSLYGVHYENSFENYQQLPDQVSQLFLEVQRDFEGDYSNVNLAYRGNLSLFQQFPARNYHEHNVLFNYALQLNRPVEDAEDTDSSDTDDDNVALPEATLTATLGDSLQEYLSLGANVGGRVDREAYIYHSNVSVAAYAKLKHCFSPTFVGRAQYSAGYRNYLNLEEMSNWQNVASLGLGKYFTTGTGMTLESSFGYKKYLHTVADTTRITGKPPGKGKAGGSENRRGRIVITKYDTPGTSQLVVALGLLQQVTSQTMLGLKYLRRMNPSDNAHYITHEAQDFLPNDEIYDDCYSYHGDEFGFSLKQELPWKITMYVLGNYFIKHYNSPAFDLDGNEISDRRQDKRMEISFGLTKSLHFASGFAQGITFELTYDYQRNQSNDGYNDFFNHTVTLGLGTDF